MNTLAEVLAAVQSRERWVVTSHARPDGDAVGSVLGCTKILRAMGKQADAYLHDPVPFIYRGLPGAEEVRTGPVDASRYDGAVILECDSVQRTRLTGLESLFLVNIDHHNTPTSFADVNYLVPSAAATAELITDLADIAGVLLTPEMATCLYTALLTDTGSFCYNGTTARTFKLAEALVNAGANPVTVAQQVYFSNPASKMLLLGRALSNLRREGPLTWMHVMRTDMNEAGAAEEDCEGLVNWALGIEGVEAAAFFREIEDDRFRVSLRSKGGVDVSRIAESFGGGGHACASGHSIAGPLASAQQRVLGKLREALVHG